MATKSTRKKQNWLSRMITDHEGGISSKIVVGSVSFIAFVITFIIISFTNPEFTNLDDIIVALIGMSAGLVGLTSVDNYAYSKHKNKETTEDSFEEPDDSIQEEP